MTGAEQKGEGSTLETEIGHTPADKAAWTEEGPLRETTRGPDEPPIEECVLVGPPGSGKTSFIAAIARAGLLAEGSRLSCRPLGQATWLLEDACWALRRSRRLVEDHQQAGSYSFDLTSRAGGGSGLSVPSRRRIILHDTYEFLFSPRVPDESERYSADPQFSLLAEERAKCARYLVLCADPFDPRPDDWQTVLVSLIDNLFGTPLAEGATRGGRASGDPIWPAPVSPHRKSERAHPGTRVLGFDRILVLFSRVDLLCLRILEAATHGRVRVSEESAAVIVKALTRDLSGLCPSKLPGRVDLVAQAMDLVSEATLSMLLGSMKDGADLGIGFVSAGGFDASHGGRPFLRADGCAADQQAIENQDVLRNWRPFGVLEALDFLICGRAAATVCAVDRRAISQLRRVRWL